MKIRISLQPSIEIRPKTHWKSIAIGGVLMSLLLIYSAWVLNAFYSLDAIIETANQRTLAINREIRLVSIEADKLSLDLPGLEHSILQLKFCDAAAIDLAFEWSRLFDALDECLVSEISMKSIDARLTMGHADFTIAANGTELGKVTESVRRFHDCGKFRGVFLKSHGFAANSSGRDGEGQIPFVLSALRPGDDELAKNSDNAATPIGHGDDLNRRRPDRVSGVGADNPGGADAPGDADTPGEADDLYGADGLDRVEDGKTAGAEESR